jgi:hypothetical protein
MQGTIAQIVALTTHGNSILQGAPNSRSLEFSDLEQYIHLANASISPNPQTVS